MYANTGTRVTCHSCLESVRSCVSYIDFVEYENLSVTVYKISLDYNHRTDYRVPRTVNVTKTKCACPSQGHAHYTYIDAHYTYIDEQTVLCGRTSKIDY